MNVSAKNEAKQLLDSIDDNTIIIPKLYKDKDKEFLYEFKLFDEDIINIVKELTIKQFRSRIICNDKRFNIDYLYDFKCI